jgi:3-deoxy-D-manno-octulosonic-acid transferase
LSRDAETHPSTAGAHLPALSHAYNVLWYPALPFALLAAGGRNRRNCRERLGMANVSAARGGAEALRVWVHAASVGEIEAMRPIVLGLVREAPRAVVVVTSMTAAGRDAARRRIPGLAAYQLAPLDWRPAVRAFLSRVRPRLVLIAETELWPNFFAESARAGARLAIVNGRLSERSFRRYRLIRPLIANALANAALILAQTDADAERFRRLGVPRVRIAVTGNTKFELEDGQPLRPVLMDFAAGKPLLIAGSTAPGEERMVLNAWRNLTERFPALALVIAPRHLERTDEVEEELQTAGVEYARASTLAGYGPTAAANVLLLDTMGELRALYSRAVIAFVGGSMAPPRGGQNLAEPAAAAVPVLFGPYYANQSQVGDALIEGGGGRVINDAAQLESTCGEWLTDDAVRRAAGERARRVIEQLAGGVVATLEHLKTFLAPPLTGG